MKNHEKSLVHRHKRDLPLMRESTNGGKADIKTRPRSMSGLGQKRAPLFVSSALVSTMAELFSFLRFFLIRVRLWRAVA